MVFVIRFSTLFTLVTLILILMMPLIEVSFLFTVLLIVRRRPMAAFLEATFDLFVAFVEFLESVEVPLLMIVVVKVCLLLVLVFVVDIVEAIGLLPFLVGRRVAVIVAFFALLLFTVGTVLFCFVHVPLLVSTFVAVVPWTFTIDYISTPIKL